jgi:hypothetical protein
MVVPAFPPRGCEAAVDHMMLLSGAIAHLLTNSRKFRAGSALRALAAESASAGDLRSYNPGALIGMRHLSRSLPATVAALGLIVTSTSSSHAQAPSLGTAASFGVLAGTTVTNTVSPTVINGNRQSP